MAAVYPLEIIYIGDPMCSWCYGFSPEISQLKELYADEAKFTLIMGGLRAGGGDAWDEKMKRFLKNHWEHVAKASGQEFGYELLERAHFDYDTEPACRAVRVVRDMASRLEFDFFKAVQRRFYVDNKDPKAVSFYQPICDKLGIPFIVFRSKFLSDKYKKLLQLDFEVCRGWEISSFPTVVLGIEGRYQLLAKGYTKFETLKEKVQNSIAAVRN